MAQNQKMYDEIDDEVSINTSGAAAFWAATFGKFNGSGLSQNMTLNEMAKYAEKNYGKEYKSLIDSDEYKNATRKEKREKLANLIETNRRQELIDEKFKEN